jgi:undecaprenyl diphosphate synthase
MHRFHLAIIMDGNGRWATSRSLPRLAGHHRGAETLRLIAEAAPEFGISDLTVYAFSSDNWKRPPGEVDGLMDLFARYLASETGRCVRSGIRLQIIGRRDRLPPALVRQIEEAESATRQAALLTLRLAVDYSSRAAILGAQRSDTLDTGIPDVDLLIRTAGEQRLSDFLLWESAYAEFWFTPKTWPEFTVEDLRAALESYGRRQRKFGALVYSDALPLDARRTPDSRPPQDPRFDSALPR